MSDVPGAPVPDDPSKRKFFATATHALGACVTCAVVVPVAGVALHPLIAADAKASGDGFVPVGSAGRFKVEDPFVRVVVKTDRTDAWLSTRGVPTGSILVKRKGKEDFAVFSAKCPHLGCAVNPVPGESTFACPCHNSSFGADGGKIEKADGATNPAPRGLDSLEWRVSGGVLEVKFVNYKTGTAEQVAIG